MWYGVATRLVASAFDEVVRGSHGTIVRWAKNYLAAAPVIEVREDVRQVLAGKPTPNVRQRLLEAPQGQKRPARPANTTGISAHDARRRGSNSGGSGGNSRVGWRNSSAEITCRSQAPGEGKETGRSAQSQPPPSDVQDTEAWRRRAGRGHVNLTTGFNQQSDGQALCVPCLYWFLFGDECASL